MKDAEFNNHRTRGEGWRRGLRHGCNLGKVKSYVRDRRTHSSRR